MFGFTSRESLTKRQLGWTREIHEPPVPALGKGKRRLISTMSEEDASPGSLDTLIILPPKNDRGKGSTSVQEYSNELERIYDLIGDLRLEIETLREKLARSNLEPRLRRIESKLNRMASTVSTASVSREVPAEESSSEVTQGSSEPISDSNSFLPYFIRKEFTEGDNISHLDGNHLTLGVEITAPHSEQLIVYPFEDRTDMPNFAPMTLQIELRDLDGELVSTVTGILSRNADGVYIITVSNTPTASNSELISYPVILSCSLDLIPIA